MRLVPLYGRRGVRAYAKVDDETFSNVARFRWHLHPDGYACRRESSDCVLMHRYLLGMVPGDGRKADHRNRDRLDNRLSNLREAQGTENAQNRGAEGQLDQRGVTVAKSGRFVARAAGAYLGVFDSPGDAALAAAAGRATLLPFSAEAELIPDPLAFLRALL